MKLKVMKFCFNQSKGGKGILFKSKPCMKQKKYLITSRKNGKY